MLLALGAATFAGGFALRRHGGVAHGGARRAVLFDQIAADDPRTDFRADIARSLAAAGVALRVVPPEEATVARFQDLPADRARLVVVRAHAALVLEGGAWTEDVALFTSDPVDLSRFEVTGLDAVATALPYEDQRGAAPVEPSS